MKLKNGTNKIDWKAYKEELTNRSPRSVFNEYERDLHTMTMKEGSTKKCLFSPKYIEIKSEMTAFDKTNLDYFKYEKDLNFGEFDD